MKDLDACVADMEKVSDKVGSKRFKKTAQCVDKAGRCPEAAGCLAGTGVSIIHELLGEFFRSELGFPEPVTQPAGSLDHLQVRDAVAHLEKSRPFPWRGDGTGFEKDQPDAAGCHNYCDDGSDQSALSVLHVLNLLDVSKVKPPYSR